jgi:hypothetical protein
MISSRNGCSAVLTAVLTPRTELVSSPVKSQAAAHAVSLVALLPEVQAPYSKAEELLMKEWLNRLT